MKEDVNYSQMSIEEEELEDKSLRLRIDCEAE
jgi:hypothetical protein